MNKFLKYGFQFSTAGDGQGGGTAASTAQGGGSTGTFQPSQGTSPSVRSADTIIIKRHGAEIEVPQSEVAKYVSLGYSYEEARQEAAKAKEELEKISKQYADDKPLADLMRRMSDNENPDDALQAYVEYLTKYQGKSEQEAWEVVETAKARLGGNVQGGDPNAGVGAAKEVASLRAELSSLKQQLQELTESQGVLRNYNQSHYLYSTMQQVEADLNKRPDFRILIGDSQSGESIKKEILGNVERALRSGEQFSQATIEKALAPYKAVLDVVKRNMPEMAGADFSANLGGAFFMGGPSLENAKRPNAADYKSDQAGYLRDLALYMKQQATK